ncbi:MAG: hypothetical protein FJ255_05080 [Phycisphaerae bacterium]|nr:hypothetical protein [Phycisphaerae bacterium]
MTEPAAPAPDQPAVRAPLMRRWALKMGVFLVVLVGFGGWALYDAAVLYPARQREVASFLEYDYLQALHQAGGARLDSAGVADPAAEFQRLAALRRETGSLGPIDNARYKWLEALAIINALDAQRHTAIPREGVPDARARRNELAQRWTVASGEQRKSPKPLTRWDIPSQWLILVACWAAAGYMALLIVRTAGRKYTWDPTRQRLTLPDGSSLVPADLDDVDKRKWDKFLVFLKVKPGHETLGGKEVRLDLYRHDRLESWVLEMERAAFPDRAEKPAEPAPGEGKADAQPPNNG